MTPCGWYAVKQKKKKQKKKNRIISVILESFNCVETIAILKSKQISSKSIEKWYYLQTIYSQITCVYSFKDVQKMADVKMLLLHSNT